MNMKARLHTFEEDAKILDELSHLYGENSKEYIALRHASIALWYVLTEGHDKFKKYLMEFEGGLTPEQRSHLAEMGIEPDAG
jgi:hypothetical protein